MRCLKQQNIEFNYDNVNVNMNMKLSDENLIRN